MQGSYDNWDTEVWRQLGDHALISLCPKLSLGWPARKSNQNPEGKGSDVGDQSLAEKVGFGYDEGLVENDIKVYNMAIVSVV